MPRFKCRNFTKYCTYKNSSLPPGIKKLFQLFVVIIDWTNKYLGFKYLRYQYHFKVFLGGSTFFDSVVQKRKLGSGSESKQYGSATVLLDSGHEPGLDSENLGSDSKPSGSATLPFLSMHQILKMYTPRYSKYLSHFIPLKKLQKH